ncbi:hypothetical protein KNU13_gp94 [Gordonia phage Turuncu]|uniref:Uncharacterized protein n=1 Tax=Gordonia phage Turuncu TaxID=2315610 RepID=A0A386KDA8_9CAUD|nr:hypothetical protein KNU13_gp94 [Gordonia phage Turuncu]AYD82180.1 hypothetical protein SEA_TURUNCU_94 [Gordonia phage Turuncu]
MKETGNAPAATRQPMARHRRATHTYRDTLIGPNKIPITRGYTGAYVWSRCHDDTHHGHVSRRPGRSASPTGRRAHRTIGLLQHARPSGRLTFGRPTKARRGAGWPAMSGHEDTGPLVKPLPATGLYRAMDSGHRNRHGHGLLAHLESTDGGALWSVVTDCCRPAAD